MHSVTLSLPVQHGCDLQISSRLFRLWTFLLNASDDNSSAASQLVPLCFMASQVYEKQALRGLVSFYENNANFKFSRIRNYQENETCN